MTFVVFHGEARLRMRPIRVAMRPLPATVICNADWMDIYPLRIETEL